MAVLGKGTRFERTQKDDNSVNFYPTTKKNSFGIITQKYSSVDIDVNPLKRLLPPLKKPPKLLNWKNHLFQPKIRLRMGGGRL